MFWRTAGLLAAGCLTVSGVIGAAPVDAQVRAHIPQPYTAAQAERGGAALANVRGLHVVIVRTRPTEFASPNRGGGGLPPMGGMDGGPSQLMLGGRMSDPMGALPPTSIIQLWLALPNRFVERGQVSMHLGVDGDRVIGGPSFDVERQLLMRWAVSLLLVDPATFDLTLTDEGQIVVGRQGYDEVQASGPDGFQSMLLFDMHHRLAALQWEATTMHGESQRGSNGQVSRSGLSPSHTTARQDYSDFKRVHGIEFPFTIKVSIGGQLAEIDYVREIDLNPKGLDKAFK
jgi:hypothetical protein